MTSAGPCATCAGGSGSGGYEARALAPADRARLERGGDAARRRLGVGAPRSRARVLAALALPPLAAVIAAAWVSYRRLLTGCLAALVLFGLAAAVTAPGLHLALAAAAFAASLVVAAQSWRGTPQTLQQTVAKSRRESVRDYVTLTKPRIMTLLLLTGFCGMVVGAGRAAAAAALVAATMVGLALACGGASALNHVLDADIDRLMGKRTRSRPVAAGRVPAPYALEFGLALSALSFVLLAGVVNVLTAVLALVGNLFYVLVYTRLLKRSTPQNIVIGGAAGAVPPLVGWAAATGNLTLPALVLFAVVFLWTPPHFWALALLIKRDYAAAGVPMLPVVRGEDETAKPDRPLHGRARRLHARAGALGPVRARVPRGRGSPRRRLPLARLAATAGADARPSGPPLPLLAGVPRAALRRHGPRRGGRVTAQASSARAEQHPAPSNVTGTFVARGGEPREPTPAEGRSNALFGLGLFASSCCSSPGRSASRSSISRWTRPRAGSGSGRTITVSATGMISSTGQHGARGVVPDRLRARRLVDADGADRAAVLLEDVGTDPADVVRHLLVAYLARAPGRPPGAPRAIASRFCAESRTCSLRASSGRGSTDPTTGDAAPQGIFLAKPERGRRGNRDSRSRISSTRRA